MACAILCSCPYLKLATLGNFYYKIISFGYSDKGFFPLYGHHVYPVRCNQQGSPVASESKPELGGSRSVYYTQPYPFPRLEIGIIAAGGAIGEEGRVINI